MRAVIQRVSEASVIIGKEIHGAIQTGLLVLLGIEQGDTDQDVDWLSGKIARLRIFSDEAGQMNLSLKEVQGNILLVSQFTLLAETRKGNRPSFTQAAPPATAIPLYERMISALESATGAPLQTGRFGADMKVCLVNDGPVTIYIDSRNRE